VAVFSLCGADSLWACSLLYHPYGIYEMASSYSPECVEGLFSEVRGSELSPFSKSLRPSDRFGAPRAGS